MNTHEETKTNTNEPPVPSRALRRLETGIRIILGVLFTLSGLNHVLGFIPMPPMVGDTALFWEGLRQSGYFFPLLGLVEATAGALLLSGRGARLGLAIAAPIVVNVAVFHVALAPEALGVAAFVVAASAFLAYRWRAAYAPVLAAPSDVTARSVRVVEVILGLVFLASGVAALLGRTPPPSTAGAAVMMKGLAASGYFVPLLAGVQVAAGAMLLARRFVALTLVVLAPVVVEIVAYRIWTGAAAPRALIVSAALLAAEVWLAYAYRAVYAPLVGGGGALAASRAARRASRSAAFLASNAMASRVALEPKMNPSTIPSTNITGM